MTNIIRFPSKTWKPKTKNFYKFVMPARVIATTIAVSALLGILTAVFGPAAFIMMSVMLMFYTLACLP